MKALRSLWDRSRSFVVRRWVPVTATVAVVALAVGAGVVWTVAQPTGPDCSTLEARDTAAANVLAVACGAEVEITDERTPWANSWAAADGTFRLEMSAVPQRTLIGGEWVDIDPELVVGDDSIGVAAPVFPIFLNAGGAAGAGKPLGSIERDGHVFEIWFPLDLPVPTVEKSRVFYQLGEGIRLAVTVNADTTGFIPVVELANPAAASAFAAMLAQARAEKGIPGSGSDIGFAIEVPEALTLSVDEASQMQAVDGDGEVQFFAPPPMMWDSSGETVVYGSQVTEVASTDRLLQPSAGDRVATMATSLSGSTMVVTPDPVLMTGAETVWPVYLDPSISGKGSALRIAVRTGGYTSTLVGWVNATPTSPGEGAGYCTDVASCNVQFKQRLAWRFDGLSTISGMVGADIISGSFTVNGTHSYNCTATVTSLYRTNTIGTSTTWGTVGWAQLLGTRTESQRSSCGTNGYRSFVATAGFKWMADNNASSISLGLVDPETSMVGWKRFGYDATITVTYNRAPNVPTDLKLSVPEIPTCTTGAGRPAIATKTPTLSAMFSDPDATNVTARFEVAPLSDLASPVWKSWDPQVLSAVASGSTVPVTSGPLSEGVTYAWHAQATDGTRESAWSDWCEFTVDTIKPSMPTVAPVTDGALVSYDENSERGGVGLTGTFAISRNTDPDVVAFDYGFDADTTPYTVVPDANGNASITYTPTTEGTVRLYVKSRDAAGNVSDVRTYLFRVVTPQENAVWSLDENDGTTAEQSIGTRASLMLVGAGWGDGPHELFGSRVDDHALLFDGIDDYAQTSAPIVDTTDSFAISAHVMLDPARVGAGQSLTALSQDGVGVSGFRLEYRASCLDTTTGCWAFVMPDDASGVTEAVVESKTTVIGGEWTHLVGAYNAGDDKLQLWVCEVGTPDAPAIGKPDAYTAPRTATPWMATAGFQLGRSLSAGTYSSFWDGAIDNVRLFNGQVLSDAKIRRLCQGAEATDFTTGDAALDPTVGE